jgi:hypothetical protein
MKIYVSAANFRIVMTVNQKLAVFKRLCFIKLNAELAANVNIYVQLKINQNVIVSNITIRISSKSTYFYLNKTKKTR